MAKSVNPGDQLTTHITGILAHGQNKFFSFLDYCQYPHDSNLTINLILAILHKISEMSGSLLPPVLYLQADNCWRENKNKYVLAFCELLVHMKVFQEVHLSFLYVGHTHEDIDAGFSRIADSLRRNDAETIPELKLLLPNPEEINYIYNIKDWLQPSLNDIRKHTKPLHYKFSVDQNAKKMSLLYKSSQEKPWKVLDRGMFAYDSKGKAILSAGIPNIVLPSFEKIQIEKMESRISDWKCLFSDQVDNTQYHWWKNQINYYKKLKSDPKYLKAETKKASWKLPKLPRIRTTENQHLDIGSPPEDLINMINQELEDHEVQIIQKRKQPPSKKDEGPSSKRTKHQKQKSGISKIGTQKRQRRLNLMTKRAIYYSLVGWPILFNKHYYNDMILELLSSIFMFLIWLVVLNIWCAYLCLLWNHILKHHTTYEAKCDNILEILSSFENLQHTADLILYERISYYLICLCMLQPRPCICM